MAFNGTPAVRQLLAIHLLMVPLLFDNYLPYTPSHAEHQTCRPGRISSLFYSMNTARYTCQPFAIIDEMW